MNLKLVYLQEERVYEVATLRKCIEAQLQSESNRNVENDPKPADSVGTDFDVSKLDKGFFMRMKEAMDRLPREDRETSVVETGTNDSGPTFKFKFIGLYDYVDRPDGRDAGTDTNLTCFFLPKFIAMPEFEKWPVDPSEIRDTVLQAIDRRNRELSKSDDQTEETEERRESLLERAVRVLRDYLENGVYTVQRRDLEHNGQGEIDWETTIDQYQPVFLKKDGKPRPVYMDYATELAWSDEDHYITRLHQCLVTTWGRKLEELGLSSVLRVNVPLLSEEELDWFGEPDYQIAQIDKELRLQFVTKSRHTLSLMKDLIRATAENKAANLQSLSFGMNGAAQLWETACAVVLGSELGKNINDCGLKWPKGGTFRDYMPRPIWRRSGSDKGIEGDEKNAPDDSIKSGWRLDFIRTYPPNRRTNDPVTKLVILDAKYYNVQWIGNPIAGQTGKPSDAKIIGQPGIGDIAKQIFYQMAFQNLAAENKKADGTPLAFVNAFLFPEDDKKLKDEEGNFQIKASERVHLGWGKQLDRDEMCASAFKAVNLFAVRLPGIELLRRYANGKSGDDWFKEIVQSQPTPHKDPTP